MSSAIDWDKMPLSDMLYEAADQLAGDGDLFNMLLNKAKALEANKHLLENVLHKMYAHPDYQYEQTVTGRKQPDYKGEALEEDGWEAYDFYRDDYTDHRRYRKLKEQPGTPPCA